jgi:hypothetical protein
MTRPVAVVAAAVALAAPSAASAASLTVSPEKRCYSAGEQVNLLGSGFSPLGSVTISRGETVFDPIPTDSNGAFNGLLKLALSRGKQTRTYTAADDATSSLTASAQITVSSVRVNLSPANGSPGRLMTIDAHGFSTGKTLWAHVRHGESRRTLKIGALHGACGALKTRRRLLPRNAALGVHTVQFDTFKRYKPKQPVRYRYTIAVSRG